MGHDRKAKALAIEKQRLLYAANKVGKFPVRQLHWLYGRLSGYGYRPMLTILAMTIVWAVSGCAYLYFANKGLFGPSSTFVTANLEIQNECGFAQGDRETAWTRCSALPQEYTTFSPWLYSADLVLPLVDLQQEKDWAPIVTKDNGVTNILLGSIARILVWIEILSGWMLSLLLVGVMSNLVKKD
jgi:hypothetical protein